MIMTETIWLWILQGVLTLLFAILSIFAKQLLDSLKDLVKTINELKETFAWNSAKCTVTHQNIADDLKEGKERFDGHDKRIGKLENRVTRTEAKLGIENA